jgi:hypothetical protein
MKLGMLNKLCALLLLALAASPFTAPFQTCGESNATVAVELANENDPGSLFAPRVTKSGHATIVPLAALSLSYSSPIVALSWFAIPTIRSRQDSSRPIVLRV